MTVIDARTREAALDRLGAQRYDVVVVGGGVTGAGVAPRSVKRKTRAPARADTLQKMTAQTIGEQILIRSV